MSTPLHTNRSPLIPREGMLATVRNRRALITAVDESLPARGEITRVVRVDYMDTDAPAQDDLLWDMEPGAEIVPPRQLPPIDATPPMQARDFDALTHAARWLAMTPYAGIEGLSEGVTPLASPLYGSIQIEDYQLVPLVRALRMPRVSLALFDDVGLGKSVEAGLVLSELIIRRRLRRVLVICPAWLRHQWQDELKSKFSLTFDIIDRQETHQLRRRLGMDVNPWRTYPRTIASYHYLKQPDVLSDFLAVCDAQKNSATLPWDLLIVDEVHNCAPSSTGNDSALAQMVTRISKYFEHKVFLSATPHNGYTQSFTGLLEQLDPVRFTKKDSMTAAEKRRAEEIVIRRLKKDINAVDEKSGRQPRFTDRHISPLHLDFSRQEEALSDAFEHFRSALRMTFNNAAPAERMAGAFAIEILAKRLLSCPYAFADSWIRFKEGLRDQDKATEAEVQSAEKATKEELDDDAETESRLAYASRVTGSWLRAVEGKLSNQIIEIDAALADLGLVKSDTADHVSDPIEDARFEKLLSFIKERLQEDKKWVDDERLIVFTEYKTALNYLDRRLRAAFSKESQDRFRLLYGGMDDRNREEIKHAFNDADDPVRILLATDAASEGANLQETARFLLHYDIPWNPGRVDQRNGRLSRHGQARDVSIFHFASESDTDLRFLGKILKKIENVRTDLGSVNEIFDFAFRRRMIERQAEDDTLAAIDAGAEKSEPKKRRTKEELPKTPVSNGENEKRALEWLINELDLNPDSLRQTMEVAMGISEGGFQFRGPDEKGRFRFGGRPPQKWDSVIDSELRVGHKSNQRGSLPALLFDGRKQMINQGGRKVFRPIKDTVLMHLGHPLVRHSLLHLSRARFPGTEESRNASGWIVRRGPVPAGTDALVLVTIEEFAVNDLRETFHQWVRTLRFPVDAGRLGQALNHIPASESAISSPTATDQVDAARNIWENIENDLKAALNAYAIKLTDDITSRLKDQESEEKKAHRDLFRDRQQEIAKQLTRQLRDLEKEMNAMLEDNSYDLFSDTDEFYKFDKTMKDLSAERNRRNSHHEQMKSFLEKEEQRVMEHLLPRRFTLRGDVQIFPVTVEIRLPEEGKI